MNSRKVAAGIALLAAMAIHAGAQTITRRTVRAVGEATIATTPDQAVLSFSVEIRALTAQDASSTNASLTAALLGALTATLKADGTIRTTGYSINPIYNYPQNASPVLSGYQATNTVEVTLTNLARVGEILDVGTKAGATRVAALSFTLKDPEPVRLQALRQASVRARSHAEAMVTGLSLRLGNIVNIDEGGTPPRVTVSDARGATAATTTPIEVGSVSVTATLIMEIEIVQ